MEGRKEGTALTLGHPIATFRFGVPDPALEEEKKKARAERAYYQDVHAIHAIHATAVDAIASSTNSL
eukprot:1125343-Pyramimonas_sp.AAC.1